MKKRIIEIVELGNPRSLIQRKDTPITELIKTDLLIKELNELLEVYDEISCNFFAPGLSKYCEPRTNNGCKVCKWYKGNKL